MTCGPANEHLETHGLRLAVPTIATAHIFCACQGSRARRERNAQHAAQGPEEFRVNK